jgi:hypothetical protein
MRLHKAILKAILVFAAIAALMAVVIVALIHPLLRAIFLGTGVFVGLVIMCYNMEDDDSNPAAGV